MQLLIDTTVLRRDPKRRKPAFTAVERLCGSGHLTLHIPAIVFREFIGQQRDLLRRDVERIDSSLSDLLRRTLSAQTAQILAKRRKALSEASEEIAGFAQTEFENWCNHLGVEVLPPSSDHLGEVLDGYFDGNPPFQQVRSRDDFPDAFILAAVRETVGHIDGALHVVSGDKRLRNAAQALGGVHTYETLDEFISTEMVQDTLQIQTATENVNLVVGWLPTLGELILEAGGRQIARALDDETVTDEGIPDDNNEAHILFAEDPESILLSPAPEVYYYGDGDFKMTVVVELDANTHYAIFKADFYTLPDSRSDSISVSTLNDHYFDAEEILRLEVTAQLTFHVDPAVLQGAELDRDGVLELISEESVRLDSIEDVRVVRHWEDRYWVG